MADMDTEGKRRAAALVGMPIYSGNMEPIDGSIYRPNVPGLYGLFYNPDPSGSFSGTSDLNSRRRRRRGRGRGI